MKKLLPLSLLILSSCASYEPPAIPSTAPKAEISFNQSYDITRVMIAVNQECQPRVAFANPSILVLNNQFHGTNGDKAKKKEATQFSAMVEANKTHVVVPVKEYPGRTTYSWVSTGTAPIMVPRTEINFCNLKPFKWTPEANHKYKAVIKRTGQNTCDLETKILDLTQQGTSTTEVLVNTSDTAKLCD